MLEAMPNLSAAMPAPPLVALLFEAQRWIDQSLLVALQQQGWPAFTKAQSLIFGQIDAGVTRPSKIAERLGISRQAVHRSVQELVQARLIRLEPDPENQSAKRIVLTKAGKQIMTDAHQAFEDIEAELSDRIGKENVQMLRSLLQLDWGTPLS